MSHEIIYREKYGDDGKEIVFVKCKGQLLIQKVEVTTVTRRWGRPIFSLMRDIFLPQGFPDSVHPDYIPYQIWDTVQAFASTIMGILTTHSIMQGIGVGESAATPLAAAITWVLKDGTGMIGRIVFAWWNGMELDAQCKKWRLFADILNDLAMGIELMIPYFPVNSTIVLCISTGMKAIVGVAGGATRAALTQHQALRNNLADVSAKDGSQETFVNLIASFIGIFILSHLQDGRYIMEFYIILVAVHLYANYSAVKALRLNSLNEDRLALILRSYFINETIPDPTQVNKNESVLLFQNPSKDYFGFRIQMGISLTSVFKNNVLKSDIQLLLNLFQNRKYLIMVDIKHKTILVPLAKSVQSADILQAYFHACLCGLVTCIALKWPIDILLNAKSSAPSYPLMRIYFSSKKYALLDDEILSWTPMHIILIVEKIFSKEYDIFLTDLEKSEWIQRTNLLPVGAWRGFWG